MSFSLLGFGIFLTGVMYESFQIARKTPVDKDLLNTVYQQEGQQTPRQIP